MTVIRRPHLQCDWPGCFATMDRRASDVAQLREMGSTSGWCYTAGMDFCGPAERTWSDPAGRVLTRLQDHAVLVAVGGLHRPLVAASTLGHRAVSCSCGWVDARVGEAFWVPPHTPLVARDRWQRHIRLLQDDERDALQEGRHPSTGPADPF